MKTQLHIVFVLLLVFSCKNSSEEKQDTNVASSENITLNASDTEAENLRDEITSETILNMVQAGQITQKKGQRGE
jgi:uncharacterized membrane protein